MPDGRRVQSGAGAGTQGRGAVSVDVALLTPAGNELAVRLTRDGGNPGRYVLPYDVPPAGARLRVTALRLAKGVSGREPAWLDQVGAFGDGLRHPSTAELSVAFVGVMPAAKRETGDPTASWVPISRLPTIAARQNRIIEAALDAVRSRLDHAPIAFRLLPSAFSLSDLQQMYELLLGRRLHKASFRRALQAAALVEPMDEWRSEGRGRPAQLFRYAPRERRRDQRGVRFEQPG